MNILMTAYYAIFNVAASVSTAVLAEAPANVSFNAGKKIIIALVVGLIVGLIYAMSLKSQLTSVYKNESAADYTRDKSFKLTGQRDIFLYSKTEKSEKPKQAQPAPAPQANTNNRK